MSRLLRVNFVCYCSVLLAVSLTVVIASAQDKQAKAFEKLVAGNEPLFVDGERVYRPNEVSEGPIVITKPEPMFTDKARKKKTHGIIELRAILKSTGEVKVLNVLKRLPYGLTERAVDAAPQIKFRPALLDGRPVSQIIRLQYNFNRY